MTRFAIALIAALAISGCAEPRDPQTGEPEREASVMDTPIVYIEDIPGQPWGFKIVCLEGVAYWYREAGHKGFLAPHYRPQRSIPTTCEDAGFDE